MNQNDLQEENSVANAQSIVNGLPSVNNFALSELLEPEHPSDLSPGPKRAKRSFFRKGWFRRYINWYLVWTAIALLSLWFLYVFPLRQWEQEFAQWWNPKSNKWHLPYQSPQLEFVRTIEFLTLGWFFYFGACIGSFFNVVAWRWPNGRGIVFGGSKCPFCNNRLGFIHNTPILGWMWCRGRCAYCKIPIATRYVWMEVAFGAVFAMLAIREVVSGGANLPGWTLIQPGGFENTVFTPEWHLLIAYLQHAFVFASIMMLVASTLDGLKFPWWGWGIFVACIALPKLIVPEIEFIPWWEGVSHWTGIAPWTDTNHWGDPATIASSVPVALQTYLPNFQTVTLGLVGGWAAAEVSSLYLPESVYSGGSRHWKMAGMLLGAVMGWQTAALGVMAAAFVFCVWPLKKVAIRPSQRDTSIAAAADEVRRWSACMITLLTIAIVNHILWRQIATMIYP